MQCGSGRSLVFFLLLFHRTLSMPTDLSQSDLRCRMKLPLSKKKRMQRAILKGEGGGKTKKKRKIIHSINVRYAEDTNDCIIVGNFTSVLTRVDLANYRMNEWSKYECNNPTTVITMLNCPVNCGL